MNERIYLNVPYRDKDIAKSRGAKWDADRKLWYFIGENNKSKFTSWIIKPVKTRTYEELSEEQQNFIDIVKAGKNILVDACIGSGKTTSIQVLCNELYDKQILYLTYNTLLKIDAQEKITNRNVTVTNYHGFASKILLQYNVRCGIGDLIQVFNHHKFPLPHYDLLIIDEYQDIEEEISYLLQHIKTCNPYIQIVAVGDMEQKIYDKTALDVRVFINDFLKDYDKISFTKCFRINKTLASWLGDIWNKPINGVNENCKISYMNGKEIVNFLLKQKPSDILCLGSRNGSMPATLNTLEKLNPRVYNKNTIYASITDDDRGVLPSSNNGIFTTFDSSKGLERKICVVFDFTEEYWHVRINQPTVKYHILRNIFCVAASRGKNHIIFVTPDKKHTLSKETLKQNIGETKIDTKYFCSNMFDFKYIEDVQDCMTEIERTLIQPAGDEIKINKQDGLIDLSPCIGIYQEACYFKNYNIDKSIDLQNEQYASRAQIKADKNNLQYTILKMVSQETLLNRYKTQVKLPFITPAQTQLIVDRLNTVFNPNVNAQGKCNLKLLCKHNNIEIKGIYDVLYNDIIYELKFVSALQDKHFLQLAMYLIMTKHKVGILWNVYNDVMYKVTVKDKYKLLEKVVKCITKRNDELK